MGKFVVRQPDGLYAVFCTVVDDFVVLDSLTAEMAASEADGAGVGSIVWAGVGYTTEDPDEDLWRDCLSARSCSWREPGWPETSRRLAEIVERAMADVPD